MGDIGTTLILQRNCLAPKVINKIQRHDLFSSTCTIQGKVCHIIDSGACENVIAADGVDKLCLNSEVHPAPYDLSWLQRGTVITIGKCVLISFSIGSTYFNYI